MKIKIIAALISAAWVSSPAEAAMMMDATHSISLGAGIANPAATQAIGENPAGLVYNMGNDLIFFGESESSRLKPLTFGGALFSGNGMVGTGLTLTRDQGNNRSQLGFGLAADARSLGFAVGASGHYRVSGLKVGEDFGADAGVLFNPMGRARLGVTAFDVTQNISALGGGFAYDLSRSAVFVVDATTDKKLKGLAVKPALGVSADSITLTYGYGYQVDKTGSTRVIRLNSSVGLGIEFTKGISLEAYYNQVAQYYAGLHLKF